VEYQRITNAKAAPDLGLGGLKLQTLPSDLLPLMATGKRPGFTSAFVFLGSFIVIFLN